MQIVIAVLCATFLLIHHLYRQRRWKKELARGIVKRDAVQNNPTTKASEDDTIRLGFWLRFLSDSHKAQCFYSFALQIASFVLIYGKDRNRADELFLSLISADGLLPVTITLYTLILLESVQSYDVVLAGISVLLASFTGFSILLGYSSTKTINGVTGPLACGSISPAEMYHSTIDFEYGFEWNGYPNLFFAGGAIVVDVIACLLIISYFLSWWRKPKSSSFSQVLRILGKRGRTIVALAAKVLTILSLLAGTAIELYFFTIILHVGIFDSIALKFRNSDILRRQRSRKHYKSAKPIHTLTPLLPTRLTTCLSPSIHIQRLRRRSVPTTMPAVINSN